ncbi:hypothetical protein [Cytobacillus massiliigabonensis]|nr:hypothetical protein [Cytobacillus massiliigabonensis]
MVNLSIQLKNAEEFQKLLRKAASLSNQLEETLQQINKFELNFETKLET